VQTCALPILPKRRTEGKRRRGEGTRSRAEKDRGLGRRCLLGQQSVRGHSLCAKGRCILLDRHRRNGRRRDETEEVQSACGKSASAPVASAQKIVFGEATARAQFPES